MWAIWGPSGSHLGVLWGASRGLHGTLLDLQKHIKEEQSNTFNLSRFNHKSSSFNLAWRNARSRFNKQGTPPHFQLRCGSLQWSSGPVQKEYLGKPTSWAFAHEDVTVDMTSHPLCPRRPPKQGKSDLTKSFAGHRGSVIRNQLGEDSLAR